MATRKSTKSNSAGKAARPNKSASRGVKSARGAATTEELADMSTTTETTGATATAEAKRGRKSAAETKESKATGRKSTAKRGRAAATETAPEEISSPQVKKSDDRVVIRFPPVAPTPFPPRPELEAAAEEAEAPAAESRFVEADRGIDAEPSRFEPAAEAEPREEFAAPPRDDFRGRDAGPRRDEGFGRGDRPRQDDRFRREGGDRGPRQDRGPRHDDRRGRDDRGGRDRGGYRNDFRGPRRDERGGREQFVGESMLPPDDIGNRRPPGEVGPPPLPGTAPVERWGDGRRDEGRRDDGGRRRRGGRGRGRGRDEQFGGGRGQEYRGDDRGRRDFRDESPRSDRGFEDDAGIGGVHETGEEIERDLERSAEMLHDERPLSGIDDEGVELLDDADAGEILSDEMHGSGAAMDDDDDRAGDSVADESERPVGDEEGGRRRRRRRGRRRGRGGREIEVSGPGAEPAAEADTVDALSETPRDGDVEIGEAPMPRPEDEDYRFRRGRRDGRGRGRIREPREMIDVESAPGEADGPSDKKMIINIVPHEECRIALLKNGQLEEIYIERASSENHVGNIYKGIVTNVEPSIQAAFVDFGIGKNGFLHISDLHPQYFGGGNGDRMENIGRKTPRRARPPIQNCLRRGQEVIVQITKEGIGTKGPTLTTYVAIPGRFLVLTSGMQGFGVSRKIENEDQRRQIRQQLNDLELIEDMGCIARTAALGRTKQELQNDLTYLTRLWKAVQKRQKNDRAPCELYRESDLVIRTIRDVFTSDVRQILIDDPDVAQRARDFLSIFSPDSDQIVTLYEGDEPIFHKYGIEDELERLHSRHVPLRSGGSLVIDQTEALVAIDVNSGKSRAESDSEETAYRINLEAADEIPRQLRLRDLGGVVICDFIDMRDPSHRRDIEHRLVRNLKAHKERAKILRMSSFGIIEMTRQRQRASLQRSVYSECPHCHGKGLIKTAESVALDVMRLIQLAATREHVSRIEVSLSLEVATLLQNRKRAQLHDLEVQHRRTVIIHPEPNFGLDRVEIRCTDSRGRVIQH